MLPGTYTESLKFNFPSGTIPVVATGATILVIGDVAAVVIDGGANVSIRGLASTSEKHVQCGLASTSAPLSEITLRDSDLTTANNGSALEIQRCVARLNKAVLRGGAVTIAVLRSDASWIADRLDVQANGPNTILGANGERYHIDVANSRLFNTDIVLFVADTGPPGTSVRFAYSTIYSSQGFQLCKGFDLPSYVKFSIENSIVVADGGYDALKDPNPNNCTLTSTLLTRQASTLIGTSVADPQFVDVDSFDFHLKSTSPAINAAGGGTVTSMHDLDGHPRPQGMSADIGAYEFVP